MPIPKTFFVFFTLFIFSSDPELESLELLPEELLPDDEDPLLLDDPELELEFFLFLAGARFLTGPFFTFFFLSSDELVPEDELLLDEDFFRLPPLLVLFFLTVAGFVYFLSLEELLEVDELLDLSFFVAASVYLEGFGFYAGFEDEEEVLELLLVIVFATAGTFGFVSRDFRLSSPELLLSLSELSLRIAFEYISNFFLLLFFYFIFSSFKFEHSIFRFFLFIFFLIFYSSCKFIMF